MIVGINLLYLIPGKSGGTETYVRSLLQSLLNIDQKNSYIIFLPEEVRDSFSHVAGRVKFVTAKNIFGNKVKRIIWEQLCLPFHVKKNNVDVLFSPGYVAPILSSCKHVVTIHDMLLKRYPAMIPMVKRLYWKIFVPLTFWRASKVIAVSEFVKNEFEYFYPRFKEKYVVIPEAVNTDFFYPDLSSSDLKYKYKLPEQFVLCVATQSPHKNIEIVLKAVHHLKMKNVYINVVCIGNKERSTKVLTYFIDSLGLNDQVSLLGYVGEKDLRQLYSTATLFVMPSLYEGFGLPVLEAMACGCPVLSSNAGSLREVGGMAAEYFSPHSVEDLAEKLQKIYCNSDIQKELRTKGYANLTRFHWDHSAQLTLDAFNSSI